MLIYDMPHTVLYKDLGGKCFFQPIARSLHALAAGKF